MPGHCLAAGIAAVPDARLLDHDCRSRTSHRIGHPRAVQALGAVWRAAAARLRTWRTARRRAISSTQSGRVCPVRWHVPRCPVSIHFAQLGPVTCGEESWMTRHLSPDVRFAWFFHCAEVACASEDCSGRSPAGITVRPARCIAARARPLG